MSNLTDAERTIIFNALTTAAHQYEKDAATAFELAMHGLDDRFHESCQLS